MWGETNPRATGGIKSLRGGGTLRANGVGEVIRHNDRVWCFRRKATGPHGRRLVDSMAAGSRVRRTFGCRGTGSRHSAGPPARPRATTLSGDAAAVHGLGRSSSVAARLDGSATASAVVDATARGQLRDLTRRPSGLRVDATAAFGRIVETAAFGRRLRVSTERHPNACRLVFGRGGGRGRASLVLRQQELARRVSARKAV